MGVPFLLKLFTIAKMKKLGGMAEWFKAAVLKTAFRLNRNGGSNPSPSAIF
jgi:hypothetical protein